MRATGRASWQIRVDRWDEPADRALWLRAVEHVDVPAGGLVPGPLDDDGPALGLAATASDGGSAAPSSSARGDFAADWLAWWRAIAAGRTEDARPDLDALAARPALARLAAAREREFHAWHGARKVAALRTAPVDGRREVHLVRALERRRGRAAAPFRLELLVLPVRDDEVRRVRADRYLVPERVYDAADWPERLEPLVVPLLG